MDLASLKFVVDTSELKQASTEIERLGTAVTKLNKPMQEAANASKQLNKEQSETASNTNKASESVKKHTSVLERQQMILESMAEGFSKGQASTIAYAKAAGIAADELDILKNTLVSIKTLQGTDPFDKSIGIVQSWTNKVNAATEAQKLYAQGLNLTFSQMEELGREKLRLIEKYKIEGKTIGDAEKEYQKLVGTAVQLNATRQEIINGIDKEQKAASDSAKAKAYLAKEDERVNRLISEQGTISSATNNALIRYQKNLEMSGLTAGEQAKKLEAYKESLLSVQKAAGNRQVDYLSRALGPQITDIAVGLATGQSPMMVLLQQGGQLRDQFALAGVAGKDMGNMLTKAAVGMIASVKDVGIAIGGSIISVFVAAGKSMTQFIGSLTGINSAVEAMKGALVSNMGMAARPFLATMNTIGTVLTFLSGTVLVAGVAALVAYGVALKEVNEQEKEASLTAAMHGGQLGLTQTKILDLSKSFAGSTGNIGAYMGAIDTAAKAGNIFSGSLEDVTTAAIQLEKVGGQSIKETIKQASEIGDKPTEGLIKYAKQLGTIPVEILKQVDALEKAGNKTEAATLAQREYAKSLKTATDEIKENMGTLPKLFLTISEYASKMWDSILNLGRKETPIERINELGKQLAELTASPNYGTDKRYSKREEQINREIAALQKQIITEFEAGKAKEQNASKAAKFEESLKVKLNTELPKDLQLEADKAKYADRKKLADAENKNLLEANKLQYAMGLKDIGQFTNDELAILRNANAERIILNEDFITTLEKDQKLQEEAAKKAYGVQLKQGKAEDRPKALEEYNKRLDEIRSKYKNLIDSTNTDTSVSIEKVQEAISKQYELIGQGFKSVVEGGKHFKLTMDEIAEKRKIEIEDAKAMAGLTGEALVKAQAETQLRVQQSKALTDLADAYEKASKHLDTLKGQEGTSQYDTAKKAKDAAEIALNGARIDAKVAQEKAGIDAVEQYRDWSTKRLNAYGAAFEKMFSGMADAIVEFAKTGKLNFSDLINSMLADLLRFESRKMMTNMLDSMGGGKGIFNSLTSLFTGSPTTAQANGGVWDAGIQKFANGGAFTNSIVSEPTVFKFAKGTGLMGEAGPEAIMPLTRGSDGKLGVQSSGSGGNVSVQVINNSNAQATTNETTDSRGNRKIEVIIGDMTASEISRSGSASQKSMRSTFGLQPQLIRR